MVRKQTHQFGASPYFSRYKVEISFQFQLAWLVCPVTVCLLVRVKVAGEGCWLWEISTSI